MQEWPEATRPPEEAGPRASLVLGVGDLAGLSTNIWMGGARTPHGTQIEVSQLAASSFLDLAGDLPGSFRTFSRAWRAFVFPDVEDVPPRYERLLEIVGDLREAVRANGHAAPDLYMMCTHGMNRSGLATGLLLRRLGMGGEETIARITSARKGALSNDKFRELILGA